MLHVKKILFSKGCDFLFVEVEQVYHKTLLARAERSEPIGECSRSAV